MKRNSQLPKVRFSTGCGLSCCRRSRKAARSWGWRGRSRGHWAGRGTGAWRTPVRGPAGRRGRTRSRPQPGHWSSHTPPAGWLCPGRRRPSTANTHMQTHTHTHTHTTHKHHTYISILPHRNIFQFSSITPRVSWSYKDTVLLKTLKKTMN